MNLHLEGLIEQNQINLLQVQAAGRTKEKTESHPAPIPAGILQSVPPFRFLRCFFFVYPALGDMCTMEELKLRDYQMSCFLAEFATPSDSQ